MRTEMVPLLVMLVHCVAAVLGKHDNEIRILSLPWLSDNREILRKDDDFVASSFAIVPIAIQHFNERYAGIVPDVAKYTQKCDSKLTLVGGRMIDTEGQTYVAMQRFIETYNSKERIDIVQGPARSDSVRVVAGTAGSLNVPQISHLALSSLLSDRQTCPLLFRTTPSDAQHTIATAELFQLLEYSRVGLLHTSEEFGMSWKSSFAFACDQRGIRVTTSGYDSSQRGHALKLSVLKAFKLLVDEKLNVIVYLGINAETMRTIAWAANELHWIKGKLFLSPQSAYLGEALQSAQEDEHLRQAVASFLDGSLQLLAQIDSQSELQQRLFDAWPSFSVDQLNSMLPLGATKRGETYARSPNYFKQKQELLRHRSWSLAYDSILAIGFASCMDRNSSTLAENLARVSFEGTSGHVRFQDNFDRDETAFTFSLRNLIVNPTKTVVSFKEVGVEQAGSWKLSSTIVFKDGSLKAPLDVDLPPAIVDTVPSLTRMLSFLEGTVAIILSISAVRTSLSESTSLVVFALGCVLIGMSIIPLGLEGDQACMLHPWLFSLGLTVSVTCLLYRAVPTRLGLSCISVMVLLAVVIDLGHWQAKAPWRYGVYPVEINAQGQTVAAVQTCLRPDGKDAPYSSVILGLLGFLITLNVAVVCRLMLRNPPEHYNEMRRLFVAGVSIFPVMASTIPLLVISSRTAYYSFIVKTNLTFLSSLVLIGAIFLPRWYYRNQLPGTSCPATDLSTGPMNLKTPLMPPQPFSSKQARRSKLVPPLEPQFVNIDHSKFIVLPLDGSQRIDHLLSSYRGNQVVREVGDVIEGYVGELHLLALE